MKQPLSPTQIKLRKRLVEIIFANQASHMGSSLSMIDIIQAIYEAKRSRDLFVLSNGHAGYALYTVLEKHGLFEIDLNKKLPVHPERALNKHISASTGSLGQGLPIAVGMAIGNPNKKIFCTISDGEATEGSIWESLRLILDLNVTNLMVIINANGWGAYNQINLKSLQSQLKGFGFAYAKCDGHNPLDLKKHLHNFIKHGLPQLLFCETSVNHFPFLKDQDAHYYVMSEADYQLALESLSNL